MNNNSHLHKIITNTSFLFGAEIYRRIIRFALVIFAARLLGDKGYGIFAFGIAFVKLFLIFTDAGVHQLLIRDIARNREITREYTGNAILIKIILCTITSLAIVGIINLSNKPQDVVFTVYLLTLNQIFISLSLIFESIFLAHQKMKYVAYSNVISATSVTLFGIGVLLAGGNYIGLAVMYAIAGLLKLLYCIFITSRYFTKIRMIYNYTVVKYILKEGIPIGVNLIFTTIYTLVDQVMLSFMYNDEIVGWYRAAYQFVFTMVLIPEQLLRAAFPVLSKYYVESVENLKFLFNRLLKFLIFIAISLSTLVFLFSKDLITLVYGIEYINGAKALHILVWSTALIFITLIFTNTTRATNQQRFTAKIVMIGAILNILLNFLLIPKYNITGAAVSTLITEIFIWITHYIFISGYIHKPPIMRYLPKVLIINIFMVFFVMILRELNFFILFFIAIFINFALMLLFKYFTRKEFDLFKNLFLEKKNSIRK